MELDCVRVMPTLSTVITNNTLQNTTIKIYRSYTCSAQSVVYFI